MTETPADHKQIELVKNEADSFVLPEKTTKPSRRYHPVWDFLTVLFYLGCLGFFVYWFGWPWFMDVMRKKVAEVECATVCVYEPVSAYNVDAFSYLEYSIPITRA